MIGPQHIEHWPMIENSRSYFEKYLIEEPIYRFTQKDKTKVRQTFTDDFRLETVWRDKYYKVEDVFLAPFCFTPDFSVFSNDELYPTIYQIYRSRLIGAFYFEHGLFVIPVLQWNANYLTQTVRGLTKSEVVAVRSPTKDNERQWFKDAEKLNKKLPGRLVIHFGRKTGIQVWDNAIHKKLNP